MTNISLLSEMPIFNKISILTVDALAPLSMVAKMPGKYYRSQSSPTNEMLYGLLENALGWHFSEKDRNEIIKNLQKKHGRTAEASGVGFKSVLQFHLRFSLGLTAVPDAVLRYDDYWSQHLRTEGLEFFGGSREHDARLIPLVNAVAEKRVSVTDSSGIRDEDAFSTFQTGDKINLSVVRPFFPRYYVTPTPREYIVPSAAYQFRVETSEAIASMLDAAFEDPAAPLYLGSNDGWVEATWRIFSSAGKAEAEKAEAKNDPTGF